MPNTIEQYEVYFIDPAIGDSLLKPGMTGPAIANVRHALRVLGYDVEFGDQYDKSLAEQVLQFQKDNGHSSLDGLIGPGTRRLLVTKLIESDRAAVFQRMRTPAEDFVEERRTHYLEMIKILKKQRDKLELKKAKYGLAAPASLEIEFDEVCEDIERYEQRLADLEG